MGNDEVERLRAELDRRTREVGILKRVAGELNGTMDLDALLETVLAAMDDVFRPK